MRPTQFNNFLGVFCSQVVRLLGGPKSAAMFFLRHRDLQRRQTEIARQAFLDGQWGYTPQAAAQAWFRECVQPVALSDTNHLV